MKTETKLMVAILIASVFIMLFWPKEKPTEKKVEFVYKEKEKSYEVPPTPDYPCGKC